ncbi:MAG TPA: metal ABC transporter permease [Planctomycetota bacterium]|nr:metal ABC transporter permease [Planctomycetota bacterium]
MGTTLAACLILTGIHVYFGIHVIARRVIFVDLALAQIAALGTVVGVAMGYEAGEDPMALYLYSLALTAAGALVFAVTKMRFEKLPHEATIGIVYCVAFAATLLILARSPVGPSEIDRILKGEILYVSGRTVLNTALIYAAVGAFHVIFRRRFFALSFAAESQARIREIVWDFLFYLSFGFVVTSSVAIAGVFLVFSYLVIPSAGAMLFTDRLWGRLAIGWTGAGAISVLGVWLSHRVLDLPTSPLIVCLLAGALLVAAVVRGLVATAEPRRTLVRLAAAGGGLGLLVAGVFLFRKPVEDEFEHAMHLLAAKSSGEKATGLKILRDQFAPRRDEWIEAARPLLSDGDDEVRQEALRAVAGSDSPGLLADVAANLSHRDADVRKTAVKALKGFRAPAAGEALLGAAARELEIDVRLEKLDAAVERGLPGAIDQLLEIAQDPDQDRTDQRAAFELLHAHLAFDMPDVVHGGPQGWWESHREEVMREIKALDDPQATPERKRAAFENLRDLSELGFEMSDLTAVKAWWERNRDRARWNEALHRFELGR